MTQPFIGRRLLAVFAHPDDEAYAAAGLMAWCLAEGAEVFLLCLSRGEGGRPHPRSGVEVAPETLGDHRWGELKAACAAIGCPPPLGRGLPDGRIEDHLDDAAGAVQMARDRLQPDVVVTLGPDGAYGHRDHVACTAAVTRGAQGLRVLHAAFPPGMFTPIRRALKRHLGSSGLAPLPPGGLGVPLKSADIVLDLGAYPELRTIKQATLAAHRSQLAKGDPLSFLRPGLVFPLLQREAFVVAEGPPLPHPGADLFAGLP
ncbi:MAG: PIG-L deacetylase family protein [Bradymonadia bacterium]